MKGENVLENETWRKTISKAKKGNKKAQEDIISMYGNNLLGYIINITHDLTLAEDIYQEVWIKVLKNLKSYDIMRPFSPWLITIARNTIYDNKRKEKVIEFSSLTQPENRPEEELLEKERLQLLNKLIDTLSEHDKTIIILKYFEELSNEEIANKLNSDSKTIKWQLYEAKKRLKKKTSGEEDLLWNAN